MFNVSDTFIKKSEQWLSCLLCFNETNIIIFDWSMNRLMCPSVFFPCVHREPTNRILHQTFAAVAQSRWCGLGLETAAASELGCNKLVCVYCPQLVLLQLSSTPLQVLLYLNSWYFAAFYLAEILMFIYKGQSAHLHMKLVAMKTLGSKISSNFKTFQVFY